MAFGEVGTSLSKIKANSLNLAGTFGFTGTVSGLADETPLVLISTFTSDGSDSDATFTSSHITSTYKEFLFVFNHIHPETDGAHLTFNASVDNGSNYNVAKTSATFWAENVESSDDGQIQYRTGQDLAQGTGEQIIMNNLGNGNDESGAGIMRLYNPSDTTFVKNFTCRHQYYHFGNVGGSTAGYAIDNYTTGYLNTTSAVNNIRFKMSSGEIQGGTIDLFGVV
jgi:hypothetical protein